MSCYNAILAITGNDVCPKTNNMLVAASLLLIGGALYNAVIIGELQNLTASLNSRKQAFIEKLDMATTSMKNLELPERIQRTVRDFLISTQATLDG